MRLRENFVCMKCGRRTTRFTDSNKDYCTECSKELFKKGAIIENEAGHQALIVYTGDGCKYYKIGNW